MAKRDLIDFSNKLTVDTAGSQQRWHFVEYPEVGIGNASKHAGQIYLITQGSTLCGHLQCESNEHKVAFLTGAMPMTE